MSEQRKMKFTTKYSAFYVTDKGKLKPFALLFGDYPQLQNYSSKQELLNEIRDHDQGRYHHQDIAIVEVVRYVWDDDE